MPSPPRVRRRRPPAAAVAGGQTVAPGPASAGFSAAGPADARGRAASGACGANRRSGSYRSQSSRRAAAAAIARQVCAATRWPSSSAVAARSDRMAKAPPPCRWTSAAAACSASPADGIDEPGCRRGTNIIHHPGQGVTARHVPATGNRTVDKPARIRLYRASIHQNLRRIHEYSIGIPANRHETAATGAASSPWRQLSAGR